MRERTAIIVPCYNEAARLNPAGFISALDENGYLKFYFVNDGSRDATLAELENIRSQRPDSVVVINLERNGGKAEAVRRGLLEAMRGDCKIVGYWDADLATPLADIDRFVATMVKTGAELVIGSRVGLMGRRIERKMTRHYLGRVFATVASIAINTKVYDTQCGAKIFRVNDRLKNALAGPFASRWIFDVELLARLQIALKKDGGKRLEDIAYEYPLEQWADVAGSKIRTGHFFAGGLDMLKIALKYSPEIYG
ncbi:MAG: glycosyltransferase [Nitrospinae bacterium]|nr:glycosyltransferase [Nitrospinota bacterium]